MNKIICQSRVFALIAFFFTSILVGMESPESQDTHSDTIIIRIKNNRCAPNTETPSDLLLLLSADTQEHFSKKTFREILIDKYGALLAVVRYQHDNNPAYRVYKGSRFRNEFKDGLDPVSKKPIDQVWYYITPSADQSLTLLTSSKRHSQTEEKQILDHACKAITGDQNSLYALGFTYAIGTNVTPIDYEKALVWYLKAADRGNSRAMVDIGAMYYRGFGVVQSYTDAQTWWEKAFQQGNLEASVGLAFLYAEGLGHGKDLKMANFYYHEALRQGYKPISEDDKILFNQLSTMIQTEKFQ